MSRERVKNKGMPHSESRKHLRKTAAIIEKAKRLSAQNFCDTQRDVTQTFEKAAGPATNLPAARFI
jgi:hypothetical protein